MFGVITADGKVYPCEILEDKLIGDLREFDMDFLKLWTTQKIRRLKNLLLIQNVNVLTSAQCHLIYSAIGDINISCYHHSSRTID